MTIKQKQSVLTFFDCYDGIIDGDWGPLSVSGTTKLQQKLRIPDDSIFGPQTEEAARKAIGEGDDLEETVEEVISKTEITTDDWWDEIEFFDREEFRCQCGGKYCDGFPVEPSEKLVRNVDEIRRRLGIPVYIVDRGGSGVRCPIHNTAVGGALNSEHLGGNAADLHSDATPEQMKAVAEEVMGSSGGIGIYNWGIHVDVGKYSRWDKRE